MDRVIANPRRGRGDLTGEALTDTLSPEVMALVGQQLRMGRPRRQRRDPESDIRTSFVLNAGQVEKLRRIAYTENLSLREVVAEAFRKAIEEYEQEKGQITLNTLR